MGRSSGRGAGRPRRHRDGAAAARRHLVPARRGRAATGLLGERARGRPCPRWRMVQRGPPQPHDPWAGRLALPAGVPGDRRRLPAVHTRPGHRELAESRTACALAWVGAHASVYGGDTSRFALVGDSAGGHLALEMTYRQALGELPQQPEGCTGSVPQIDAVSTASPVADPVGFHDNPDLVMGPFTAGRAQRYTGGTPRPGASALRRDRRGRPTRTPHAHGSSGRPAPDPHCGRRPGPGCCPDPGRDAS